MMYEYKARLAKPPYDGDTVWLDIDLGFGVSHRHSCRLRGLNAPEVRGPERAHGLVSKKALTDFLSDQDLTIRTEKDKSGKYGRYIVTIFADGRNVNQAMIDGGYAEARVY